MDARKRLVNLSGSRSFTEKELLNPSGWILLAFIMDSRTGLGYFNDYRISNYQLMMDLIEYCRSMPVDEILQQPDVKERVDRYFDHQRLFIKLLKKNSTIKENLVITNQLRESAILVGNRFIVNAVYPHQNIDIRTFWGKGKKNIVITLSHSILNRTSRVNVGKLLSKYGGGGSTTSGDCQVSITKWRETFEGIINEILDLNG